MNINKRLISSIGRGLKLFSETYSVFRHNTSVYDSNGRWITTTPTEVPIQAVIEPIIGEEINDRSDGRREKDIISIWTQNDLFGTNEESKIQPDIVQYDGKKYRVGKVRRFVSHVEATAEKLQE